MVWCHLLLLLGFATAEGAAPEEWAREKIALTSRIKELEREVAGSWCDTRDTRGFVVSGLMVTCPAGKVFSGTAKDSGLVSCLPGGCPRYVPDDTCQERGEGTTGILLTGGSGQRGSKVPDFLYPASSSCTPPPFPDARLEHVTFTTPSGLVASCGGKERQGSYKSLSTCLVLEAGQWQSNPRVPDLPAGRYGASVATVPAGVVLMGGQNKNERRNLPKYTSFVLRKNGSSWEEGPALTGFGATYSCSMAVGDSVFLTGGAIAWKANQVRELDTSTWEWQEEGKWPQLRGKGRALHGCAVLNSQLVVAGGQDSNGFPLDTTSTLDLGAKGARWTEGGKLKLAKYFHAMVTMGAEGQEKLYALGGGNDGMLDSVEVWDEESRTWREEQERLPKGKGYMGAVAVTEAAVCKKKEDITRTQEDDVLVIAGGMSQGEGNVTIWPPHPSCHLPGLPSLPENEERSERRVVGSLLLDQQKQLTFLGKEPTPAGTPRPLDGHMCLAMVNTTWEGSCSQRVHRAGAMFAPTTEGVLALGGVNHWDPDLDNYLTSTEVIMPGQGFESGKPWNRFDLDRARRHACLIMDEDTMVVTGGEGGLGRRKFSLDLVSGYSLARGSRGQPALPSMLQARAGHACGLVTLGGSKALVVAGGFFWEPSSGSTDTTEMLLLTGPKKWAFMGPLPSPRYFSAGGILGGTFILSGGMVTTENGPNPWDSTTNEVAEMLELELPSGSWKTLQPMEEARSEHGMVAVTFESIKKFCTD